MFAEKKTMNKKRKANIRSGMALRTFVLLPFVVVFLLVQAPMRDVAQTAELPSPEKQALLNAQSRYLWQKINQARHEPRKVIEHLGLDIEQVEASLGELSWIIEAGLPPLAWNGALEFSAEMHGQDMADHLYYAYQSLDGRTIADRISDVGVVADKTAEALAILAFSSYMPLQDAVQVLLDNLLRDELLAPVGTARTLMSPDLTEIGISFFAENLQLIMGQQYVYLLVIDAAAPLGAPPWLVGQAEVDSTLFLRDEFTGFTSPLPVDASGAVQIALSVGGIASLYELEPDGLKRYLTTVCSDVGENQFVDLTDNE